LGRVHIGGGVPTKEVDIRLAIGIDLVVISKPTGEFGGVVQYKDDANDRYYID
jgi:hypothetical protein